MGKQPQPRRLSDEQARAVGRNIRVSPRKLNLVAQLIRGKSAEAALTLLTFSPKRIARDVKKILQSAIANAENNHDLDVDNLVVSEASVGRNMVMKRFHARARGRSSRIEKPFAQVTIVVEEKSEKKEARKAKPAAASESKGDASEAKKPAAKKSSTASKAKTTKAASGTSKSGKSKEKA